MALSESYIISAFKRLNQALKALNNEIIVLDFSHFSPTGNNNTYDIHFKFIADKESYKNAYSEYIKVAINDRNSIWRKYEKGNERLLYNFNNTNKEVKEKKEVLTPEPAEKESVKLQSDFEAQKHLIEGFSKATTLPGQCFVIYAESHGDAQSIVYVLLKNKIGTDGRKDLKNSLPSNFNAFDKELHGLLLHEMIESLVEEKASLYRQVQDLKTQTMFSLTTHSLKTHLNTTVIKEKNAFLDKLEEHAELKKDFEKYLGKEVDTLFRLTEILSLVDKINDKQKFIDTGKGVGLLSESKVIYNLNEHLSQFNRRKNIERTEPDIKICSTANLDAFNLPIKIYELYFGKDLIELFFNTIFENIVAYGKVESNCRTLVIHDYVNEMLFSNYTEDKTVPLDETNLTGNYRLFKKLLEDTNSGTLSIPSVTNYEFKITICYGK